MTVLSYLTEELIWPCDGRETKEENGISPLSLSIRMSVCVDWITRLEYVRRLRRGNSIEESVTGEPPTMIRRGQSLVGLFKVRENLQVYNAPSSHLEALQTEASPIYHHYRNLTVTKPSNEISKLNNDAFFGGIFKLSYLHEFGSWGLRLADVDLSGRLGAVELGPVDVAPVRRPPHRREDVVLRPEKALK